MKRMLGALAAASQGMSWRRRAGRRKGLMVILSDLFERRFSITTGGRGGLMA
jgi:hypothetical protein